MLVLSRKSGESIVIDGNIEVSVLRINGNRIRLGIHAPPEISIQRREIALKSTFEFQRRHCRGSCRIDTVTSK